MNASRTRSTLHRVASVGVWIVGTLVCAAVLVVSKRDRVQSVPQRDPDKPASPVVAAGNREPVRTWLRENTPTGKWEEIQWQDAGERKGWRILKLKYRTENPLGGMSVLEEVFYVADGDARQRDEMPDDFWEKWE